MRRFLTGRTEDSETSAEPQGGTRTTPGRDEAAVTGAAYAMLFMLGFLVGVYGAFYHSLSAWGVPLGAIIAVAVNFVVCRGAGWMMGTRPSALLPAASWLIAVMLLSSKRSGGDVLITSSSAGYILLFGGTVAAAVAVAMSFVDIAGHPRSGPTSGTTTHG